MNAAELSLAAELSPSPEAYSGYMRPPFSCGDFLDSSRYDPKQAGDIRLSGSGASHLSDQSNVLFREFAVPLILSAAWAKAALLYGVFLIILIGSRKEMARPEAGRIIAVMAHKEPLWEVSVTQNIRKPVRGNSTISGTDTTISGGGPSACPLQTWVTVPWKRGVVCDFGDFLLQKLKVGNLVAHRAALLRPCFAGAVVVRSTRPLSFSGYIGGGAVWI